MNKVKICWVIPQYTSLNLKAGKGSPLEALIAAEGRVISYDSQCNYPHSTAIITTARKLQSALPEYSIDCSILNLTALPRDVISGKSGFSDYLGGIYAELPFGNSLIEARRLGRGIEEIPDIQAQLREMDLIVVSSSFETHVREMQRIAIQLKSLVSNAILMCSGYATYGYENLLLSSGYNLVFAGSVNELGDLLLRALLENDKDTLASLPGVSMNIDRAVRNTPLRSHTLSAGERRENIRSWKSRLENFHRFVPVAFRTIGRPDLECDIPADPAVQYCCVMQDLPCKYLASLLRAGDRAVFAADDFFMTVGCPRSDCEFCHASAKGAQQRSREYSLSLLDFYRSLGITDLIPTDDQIFYEAARSSVAAADLALILERACEYGFTFSYGNGLETMSLLMCFEKARSPAANEERTVYGRLVEAFLKSMAYIYLPYERIDALSVSGGRVPLAKLGRGKAGFETMLGFLNDFALAGRRTVDVGTNIIFSESPQKDEIENYYRLMDEISVRFSGISMRFNGFFMIPSNCAPHIARYRREYSLFSDLHPELKIVSLPGILKPGESDLLLEQQLAWNLRAQFSSRSQRVLRNGVYGEQ